MLKTKQNRGRNNKVELILMRVIQFLGRVRLELVKVEEEIYLINLGLIIMLQGFLIQLLRVISLDLMILEGKVRVGYGNFLIVVEKKKKERIVETAKKAELT